MLEESHLFSHLLLLKNKKDIKYTSQLPYMIYKFYTFPLMESWHDYVVNHSLN